MPTRPPSPDPSSSASPSSDSLNPFASLGAGLGLFQDWMKAAGSALPNLQGAVGKGVGASALPAWSLPTLDPAELEKRIQDLKTVQFWLEQNARMIAMTIQGLEVQRMTLTTLQNMNVSMDAVRDSLKARAAAAATPPPPEPAPPAYAPPPTPAPPASAASSSSDEEGASDAAGLVNPMRWWDTLTQQFTHLATQAAQSAVDSGARTVKVATKAGGTSGQGGSDHGADTTRQSPAAKKGKASESSSRARSGTTRPTRPSRQDGEA